MQGQHVLKDTHLLRKSKSQINETVQLDKVSVRCIYLSLPSLTSVSGYSRGLAIKTAPKITGVLSPTSLGESMWPRPGTTLSRGDARVQERDNDLVSVEMKEL